MKTDVTGLTRAVYMWAVAAESYENWGLYSSPLAFTAAPHLLVPCGLYFMQMPPPRAITTLIAAPQGVLRNFYPLQGYCLNKCENLTKDLFFGKCAWCMINRAQTNCMIRI
jgi:hypothetical protein